MPVLSNDTAQTDQPWAKACDSYLGAGWGNDDLQQVIGHDTGIRWVDPSIEKDWPHAREFLMICGVFEVPKLTEYNVSSIQKDDYWNRVKNEFPEDQPKKHREIPEIKCRDPKPKIEKLSGVRIPTIDLLQAAALLRLIKKGWTSYFQSSSKPVARFEKNGKPTDFFAANVWFQELLENLQIASSRGSLIESGPLGELWVKGYETPDWAWHLFPRLNAEQISSGDPDFEKWILDSGFMRTRSSDIPLTDWSLKILPALEKQITEASDQEPLELKRIAVVATYVYRGLLSVFKTGNPQDLFSTRVCWDGKKLRLGEKSETIWAVFSELELEFWRDHLPVYLFRKSDAESPAFDALGYKRLDKALAISLENPFNVESDGPRTDELQDFAAWLFADRRNQIDIYPPIVSWQKVKVHTQSEIRVKSTIEGKSLCDTRPHFFDEANSRLIMSLPAWNDIRLRAAAFVEAFKLPTAYRDRVEILLSLETVARSDRMIEEGIHASDLQTWLKEYRGEQMIHERDRLQNSPPSPTSVAPPTGTPMREGNTNPKDADVDPPVPVPLHGAEVQPVFPDESPPKPNPPSNAAQHSEPNSPRNHSRRKPPHDALDVEKRSREIVKRELELLGYEVDEMDQQNRGFDLKAKCETEVVIIEVKGNKDSTSEVFLTPAELETATQAGNGYRWQLWHVSRLARDSGAQPEIRIYESIPPEALTPDSFILDLSSCTPVLRADL